MSEDLSPRDRIAQQYRVGDLVHRRPYANVYDATRDGDASPRFTAWQLRGIFAVSPEGARRFADALSLVRAVSTPSIVRVIDHEVLPSGPVVLTETPRAPTLRERLLRSHRLPQPDVVRVVRTVASVLDELHGRDAPLVHRALSPDEIHIDAENCVVQACGFVYAIGASGMLRGTRTGFSEPAYRVPEALADTLDPRADLFSLASIVFECLTGERAFPGDDPVAVAAALRREQRPSARALRAEIPAEVDAVLLRAWSTDLKIAYPTAWAFARDLSTALGSLTDASPAPARTTPVNPVAVEMFAHAAPTAPLSMSEPSVMMLNPSFTAHEALPNEGELDAAFGQMLDERPDSGVLIASNPQPSVARVRIPPPRSVSKIEDAPLFAPRPQHPPKAWVPPAPPTEGAVVARPRTVPPPSAPPPPAPPPSAPPSPAPGSPWGMNIPKAIADEDEGDAAFTREYDRTKASYDDSEAEQSTQVYAPGLIERVHRLRAAGVSVGPPHQDTRPPPPVGRVPPPAADSARSVMRAPTLNPPLGRRADPPIVTAPVLAPRSVPPSFHDAPPVGVVPHARPTGYGSTGQRAPSNGVVQDALRASTHPGLGSPLRGPSASGGHNALRVPTNPGVSHTLRGPSAQHPAISQAQLIPEENRPPPVGVVPSADTSGGHRARIATGISPRVLRPPTPSADTSSQSPDASGRSRALVLSAPGGLSAPLEHVPTSFPRAHHPPIMLVDQTPAAAAQHAPRGFFGQHRSAAVLGGSIVLAALIFTLGQVYVAQSPTTAPDPTPRTHIRAEPSDATRLSVGSAIQQCIPRPYPAAATAVRFNVQYEGASGTASLVHVDEPFAQPPTSRCIERAARATSVPAFAATNDSVDYVVPLY